MKDVEYYSSHILDSHSLFKPQHKRHDSFFSEPNNGKISKRFSRKRRPGFIRKRKNSLKKIGEIRTFAGYSELTTTASSPTIEGRTWENIPSNDKNNQDSLRLDTTPDPSIPENPVGLKNPSLLLGPWEETPDVRDTDATFQ